MKKILLNPTRKIAYKINRTIEQGYRPRIKQALIVFTTDLGDHRTYKMCLDTFPALGTGILTTIISEIPVHEISKEQYVLLLFAIYQHWPGLPMIFRGYTPKQVRWFRNKFGKRVFSEYATVDWWRDIR